MRFTLPLIATAATLILAPAALADTTVSVEGGNTLYVRDTPSLFDERMDVVVTRSGTSFEVTDAVGNVHAKAPCVLSGAAVKCPANAVTKARLQGGTKNDVDQPRDRAPRRPGTATRATTSSTAVPLVTSSSSSPARRDRRPRRHRRGHLRGRRCRDRPLARRTAPPSTTAARTTPTGC